MVRRRKGANLAATIKKIEEAETDRFVDLVKIAGLDPKKDFRNRNLRNVDFSNSDLAGFDLRGSDLRGANFEGATISGAVFDDGQLALEKISGAIDYAAVMGSRLAQEMRISSLRSHEVSDLMLYHLRDLDAAVAWRKSQFSNIRHEIDAFKLFMHLFHLMSEQGFNRRQAEEVTELYFRPPSDAGFSLNSLREFASKASGFDDIDRTVSNILMSLNENTSIDSYQIVLASVLFFSYNNDPVNSYKLIREIFSKEVEIPIEFVGREILSEFESDDIFLICSEIGLFSLLQHLRTSVSSLDLHGRETGRPEKPLALSA
ncbi:MAG: pentapeptide repeat-containing protein [Pseudomonadota bacterium]